jgi:hypothetical protein
LWCKGCCDGDVDICWFVVVCVGTFFCLVFDWILTGFLLGFQSLDWLLLGSRCLYECYFCLRMKFKFVWGRGFGGGGCRNII